MRVWLLTLGILLFVAAPAASAGPNLLAAFSLDDQHVLAKFDVAVTPGTATQLTNYALASLGSVNSATMVTSHLVRLSVTTGLAPGDLETLSVSGVTDSVNATPMTGTQSRSFHFGVVSIVDIQAPDPVALAGSCVDRSRFAGPGDTPGELVTIVGVAAGPYNEFTQAVMCDTSGATPRGGLFVNCGSQPVYPGIVYRFTGRIVERGGETMLKTVTHRESLYVTPRAESELLLEPTSPSALNNEACDAAQSLETGEDYEGCLVRLDGLHIWRADPANELFVVGPPGSPSDTIGVLNLDQGVHFPYDAGRDLSVTGAVVRRNGRFMVAPRGHGDLELQDPDVVFHGLPHWVFGPGSLSIVGSAPNDTLKVTEMAGDGRDAVLVAVPDGTNSYAVSMSLTPDTPAAPREKVDVIGAFKNEKQDPPLKGLSASREMTTKAKNIASAIQQVEREVGDDNQDVTDAAAEGDAAREKKKSGGAIARNDGAPVADVDFLEPRDTTFFVNSESSPGRSPMFRTVQIRVAQGHPVVDLFWVPDVQLSITRNEEVTTAAGDHLELRQEQGPHIIDSMTDFMLTFQNASAVAIWGEGAAATASVGAHRPQATGRLRTMTNPAMGVARLELMLGAPAPTEVELFDVSGRRLHHWSLSAAEAAHRVLVWDPNEAGQMAPSGVVFARARSRGAVWTTRFVLLR